MTIKEKILEILKPDIWLAVHEFPYMGTNENTLASRLPELALDGKVEGRYRQGKRFKEWHIKEKKPSGGLPESPAEEILGDKRLGEVSPSGTSLEEKQLNLT